MMMPAITAIVGEIEAGLAGAVSRHACEQRSDADLWVASGSGWLEAC
jgi:hypothetical protein